MIDIISAHAGAALEHARTLGQEYVTWMIGEIQVHFPELDIPAFIAEHGYDDIRKKFPGDNIPPSGCLLIAQHDGGVCGCIALGKLTDTIGELRALYVRPACRGQGVGKTLVTATLDEARKIGYDTVRLDTLAFMDSARNLYRSLGFYAIEPYLALPASLKPYIRFLECRLVDR